MKTPQNKASEVKRNAKGQLMKGSASVNPGGRPGWVAAITAQLETVAPDAVKYLAAVVRGEAVTTVLVDGTPIEVPPTHENRIRASEIVLSYTTAKPKESFEVTGREPSPFDGLTTEQLVILATRRNVDPTP